MCVGCKKRKQGGKSPSMDFDGGPPPLVLDDVVDQNHFDDYLEESVDVEEPSKLPLPEIRSRSVSPRAPEKLRELPDELPDENDKGDTIKTKESGFQESSESIDQEDDEWGDFAAPVMKNAVTAEMEEDDEWGAFDQARPSTDQPPDDSGPDSARSEAARQLAHQQSVEEWGAFENNASTAVNMDEDDDEWAAEFKFTSAAPTELPMVTVENLKMLEEMLDDGEFWDDGFLEEQEDSLEEEMSVVDIPALFDLESLSDEVRSFESEKQRYARLWLSLRVIEEAISLKFDWKSSEIRKNHFKAIKISVNDIKKEIRSAATMFDTASLLLPTPLQPSSSSTSSDDHQHQKTSSSPSVESPSIPAADFDWDVSGLTNPMNRANQSSAIIDVDFLSTNGKATSYTSPLQKELEQFGLTLSNGAGSGAMVNTGPNILETLMSSTSTSSGRQFRSPEVLSLDARKLLESLPDLQYLQSEVLMFPVGTNLPH